jgi:hypothetical protein
MGKESNDEAKARVLYEVAIAEKERIEATRYGQQKLKNFVAYLPTGQFIHKRTRAMWTAKAINAKLPPLSVKGEKKPIPASEWLTRYVCVVQTVWIPGETQVVQDHILIDGGFVEAPGEACFNTYLPPTIVPGDKTKADPWLEHVVVCFPDDYEHIIGFLAHAVQRPFEKVNHALALLSREQGVGKDTILAPVRQAVGPWNCAEVSPKQFMGRFNDFAASVILRISEVKNLGEADRFDFYDHTKSFAASPPEVFRCDAKYRPEQAVLNRCHLIITSNHVTGGLYLPAEDRRHYVAESPRLPGDFESDYWKKLWSWFARRTALST